MFSEIKNILDTSVTGEAAHRLLKSSGYAAYVDLEQLDLVSYEIGRYGRCLELMDEIRVLARRIFAVNFKESDDRRVLLHEVSFSYASKMLSGVGPSLGHFSCLPTSSDVMYWELRLACDTPFLALQAYGELLCLESMTGECGLSNLPDTLQESCLLEDIRRTAKRIPLASCVKRRRKAEDPLSLLPLAGAAFLSKINGEDMESGLFCDESL